MQDWKQKQLNIASECLLKHASTSIYDQPAMIFVNQQLTAEELTYRQLDDLSQRMANSYKIRGLVKGDRVLLRLPNTKFFPIAFFGALRAGIIPVPSSPMLTGAELDFLLKNSSARALITDESLYAPIRQTIDSKSLVAIYNRGGKAVENEIEITDELQKTVPSNTVHASIATDPAYLVYTSGTTGYPKGVLHAHSTIWGRRSAATNWFNFKENQAERILHSGKFNWTYVLGTAMMDPLCNGKTVVVYEGENSAERWLELLQRFDCNTFIGVPTIFRQILQKTAASHVDVPRLRHAMCAGEHLTDEVLTQWTERFGFPIYEGLGMSECSYYISQRPGDNIVPNSAGKIQPDREIKILDEDLNPVSAGAEGMICIHRDDPGLFIEYWQAPEVNSRQFKNGWFLTGDYAKIDADGYVFFLGRRDEIIKSFGYRVSPFEIERVFRDHEAIEDVVAFAEILGPEKTLISLAVQVKAGQRYDGEAILTWGKERLASYKLPKKIYQLDKFPRSANGKVLRSQIAKVVEHLKA